MHAGLRSGMGTIRYRLIHIVSLSVGRLAAVHGDLGLASHHGLLLHGHLLPESLIVVGR